METENIIDFEKKLLEFKKYILNYDIDNISTRSKVVHTYKVMDMCEKIAVNLQLPKEEIEVAKLIGLLHDIGRFDEIKIIGYMGISEFNHAEHGIDILFTDNYIRNYISSNEYDEIIKFAILNHNKFQIEETLDNKKLLFAKIIRDADKIDNFRVKSFDDKLSMNPKLIDSILENDVVSDEVLKVFYNESTILTSDRKTSLDIWISYLAFIFDINFSYSMNYIKNNDFVNIIIDRIEYKNKKTVTEMNNIKIFMKNYMEKILSNNI